MWSPGLGSVPANPRSSWPGGGPAVSNETKSCKKQNHMPCFESDACMHARTSRQPGHSTGDPYVAQ